MQVTKLKRNWNLTVAHRIVQKISKNYCPCLYLSIGQVWWLNELWFKKYIQKYTVSCTNTHHDITDLANHGMVENTKPWISWEQNIEFLWNKEILNLCLRWHIFEKLLFYSRGSISNSFINYILHKNFKCQVNVKLCSLRHTKNHRDQHIPSTKNRLKSQLLPFCSPQRHEIKFPLFSSFPHLDLKLDFPLVLLELLPP